MAPPSLKAIKKGKQRKWLLWASLAALLALFALYDFFAHYQAAWFWISFAGIFALLALWQAIRSSRGLKTHSQPVPQGSQIQVPHNIWGPRREGYGYGAGCSCGWKYWSFVSADTNAAALSHPGSSPQTTRPAGSPF